ncbi:MAG: response regulator [Bacilli bacterium]|nr:response regulator [Bacilli bacterium]
MSDIRNAYLGLLLAYSIVVFLLIMIRDTNNNNSFKKSLNLFNTCLFVFIIGLVINILGNNFYDTSNWYSLKNVFLAKGYCAYLFSLIAFLSSYYCVNIFNFQMNVLPKNKKSIFYFLFYIISIILIFALPITIELNDGRFSFTGLSVTYTMIAAFSSFVPVIIEFIMNIRKIDYFELFSPFLFFALCILSIYFQYVVNLSLNELVIAFSLVVTYFGVEKREEKLQENISNAIISLQKGARFKSDFLSNMSHEIKTPLNSILYTSRTLNENNNINYATKREINDIIYSSDMLQEVISNILMVNKLENNKANFNKINYNIKTEIKTLPFVEKMKIDPNGINFFVYIDPNVPDLIYGEKEAIRLIINNVLTFALNYVKSGSLTLKISWDEESDKGSQLVLEVENVEEGIGNLYKNIDNLSVSIFDCVQNSDFGLGLASILTNKLNGKIDLEIEENRNNIIFNIPHTIGVKMQNFDNVSYEGKKVLVVDDVNLNLKIANNVFSSLNIACDLANSGSECIEFVKNNIYDYIFLDIMMPNLNGEETLKKLKEIDGFNVPVIALTADDVPDAEKKYLEKGFSGFIIKPFTKSDIVNVLEITNGGD